MGDAEYLAAFDRVLLPIASSFRPEIVLVSTGFDAAQRDLLGQMRVSPDGFAAMTARLRALAGGRLLLALEGGYNLDAIAASGAACLRVLLGDTTAFRDARPRERISPEAERALDRVRRAQAPFWPELTPP
jgi:histone deacetylase 6